MPTQHDILEALRLTWAGQPDLSFTDLLAQIANAGGGPGATDEEFLSACRQCASALLHQLPAVLGPEHFVVITDRFRVSINGEAIALCGYGIQPVWWRYHALAAASVGETLLVADDNLNIHNYGRIQMILPAHHDAQLVVSSEYLVLLEDGLAELWSTQRRATSVQRFKMGSQRPEVALGEHLVVPTAGGEEVPAGVVERIFPLGAAH